jgi:ESCRT-II complex subunit VPS36
VELRYEGSSPLPPPTGAAAHPGSWNARDNNLTIHITTHRIVFFDETDGIAGSIPLALVQTANPSGGPSFRSPRASYKIELSTHAWGDLIIVFRGGESSSYPQSSKDRDEAMSVIDRALTRKAWRDKERNAMKEALRPSTAIAARKVGVDAIMTKNQLRHRENASLAEAAFASSTDATKSPGVSSVLKKKNNGSNVADIDAFLGEASELIKVIEKYAATIERERAAASTDGTPSSEKDTAKLAGMLENMGMTSALSEKQSGSMYHKQLARQLVDFMRHRDKLAQAGGMMTLTDVYCLFNRARATNMISPEDLLKATDLMKELHLGLSKRTFASGVAVVQDDAFDDETMAKRLADLATVSIKSRSTTPRDSVGGITAMDVSRALKISALLANEHLLSAEQRGWLCRDVTIEGIRFFPNLFITGDYSLYRPSS